MAIYSNISGADIKSTASGIANEVVRAMARWKYFADKLNTMTDQDLTDLGLSSDYKTYLSTLRVGLLNIELKYRNQTPVNTDDPSYIINLFSQLLTI